MIRNRKRCVDVLTAMRIGLSVNFVPVREVLSELASDTGLTLEIEPRCDRRKIWGCSWNRARGGLSR